MIGNERAIWRLVEIHSVVCLRCCLLSQKQSRSLYFQEAACTFHSYAPWCSPGSSGIPRSLSRSHRHGRCTGRAGNSESPRTRVSTGHTAVCTPPGNSGTGQWWGHRKHWQILADGTHKLRKQATEGPAEKLIKCKHTPYIGQSPPAQCRTLMGPCGQFAEGSMPSEAMEPMLVWLMI